MTVTELLQLYAPLAGLLALSFWVGMLSQKVADLKEHINDLRKAVGDLEAESADGTIAARLVRLEVTLENWSADIAKLNRGQEGIQRQLANLMHTKSGTITEFRGDAQ